MSFIKEHEYDHREDYAFSKKVIFYNNVNDNKNNNKINFIIKNCKISHTKELNNLLFDAKKKIKKNNFYDDYVWDIISRNYFDGKYFRNDLIFYCTQIENDYCELSVITNKIKKINHIITDTYHHL
jgi:hypothetical protein